MGKASTSGRAKTRLVPPLSHAEAARFNTAFLQDVVGNLLLADRLAGTAAPTDVQSDVPADVRSDVPAEVRADVQAVVRADAQADPAAQAGVPHGTRPGIAAYIAYAPAGSAAFFREHLPVNVGLIETCLPTFGACLLGAVESVLASGHEAACVLNSDSPTLPTACLVQAALALRAPGERVVLGPSLDGGYYLLGMKHAYPELFAGIAWSSASVCAQTEQRAAGLGLDVVRLEPWYDVDDVDTLLRLGRELWQGEAAVPAATGYAAPHSRAVFAALRQEADLDVRLGGAMAAAAACAAS